MSADIVIQIIASGLTVGAMYAVSTLGLSLIWGSLGMLNMAHGVMLTIGGYASYYAMSSACRCPPGFWGRCWRGG
jgi:branched-chain amino acid transport system permease protein